MKSNWSEELALIIRSHQPLRPVVGLERIVSTPPRPFPPAPCGCRSTNTEARAAILQRIPSALSGNSKESSATRAARQNSRSRNSKRARGGLRGESPFCNLTFTCHFRLRRTPHWGGVARECPRRLCSRVDDPSPRERRPPSSRTNYCEEGDHYHFSDYPLTKRKLPAPDQRAGRSRPAAS